MYTTAMGGCTAAAEQTNNLNTQTGQLIERNYLDLRVRELFFFLNCFDSVRPEEQIGRQFPVNT